MDYERDRARMNVEGDRLSSLPDDLINKILSYNDTKHAIKTSILSSRWKNTWKSIRHLNFSSEDFTSLPKFSQSVTRVLSSRNNEIELSSVKLSFRGKVSQAFVKKIMNYAFSHNVQKMTIIFLLVKNIELTLSLFSCQSLKDLTLIGSSNNNHSITLTSSWELPALTTLHLDHITFNNKNADEPSGLFSKCPNLKNLTLTYCDIMGLNGFTISHPQLSNLTLENGEWSSVVNVVAPHLKDLTIVKCDGEYIVSAPKLTSLMYESEVYFQFSADGLSSLEKVDFYICHPAKANAHKIVDMLQQFRNVKFLTLGLEIVEVLASSVQVISHLPSPFAKLTSFKIYPANLHSEGEGQKKINMSTEVKNYLLDGSPSATVTIFSREEIRAIRNTSLAENLMTELRVLLDQEKAKANTANMQRRKAPTANIKPVMRALEKTHVETPLISSLIQGCWQDLSTQMNSLIQFGTTKTSPILKKLQSIEKLLRELPESNRANMQASFSSLCTEANSVIKTIVDRMKFNCDAKGRHLNVYFSELARASERK